MLFHKCRHQVFLRLAIGASVLYSSLGLAAQAMPNQDPTASQDAAAQLIDIELPTQPGTNWWLGLEIGLAIVAILVLLGVLNWLRNRYLRRFRLRWQLHNLNKGWQSHSSLDNREEALRLYQLFDDAKRHQFLLAEDVLKLKESLEPLCFSQGNASRETLVLTSAALKQALADDAKQKLKALPGDSVKVLRNIVQYGVSRLQPLKQSKTDRGQKHGE